MMMMMMICNQSCEHDISKTNESILLQIDTYGHMVHGANAWNDQFGIMRLKVKITGGRG